VNGDQASSLAEGAGAGCSFDNVVIDSSADYWMQGNTRRWIQDPFSWDCYAEGRRVVGIAQAEVNGLGEGAWAPRCLADGVLRGKIVTAKNTGVPNSAYYVDGAGLWHYIADGATWSCLRSRHSVYADGLPWAQINTRRHEGSWANCSM
jgi:hypothetical protein